MALVVARGRFKGSDPEPLEQKFQRDETTGHKWNAPTKLSLHFQSSRKNVGIWDSSGVCSSWTSSKKCIWTPTILYRFECNKTCATNMTWWSVCVGLHCTDISLSLSLSGTKLSKKTSACLLDSSTQHRQTHLIFAYSHFDSVKSFNIIQA